jgi:hypothetical protein
VTVNEVFWLLFKPQLKLTVAFHLHFIDFTPDIQGRFNRFFW